MIDDLYHQGETDRNLVGPILLTSSSLTAVLIKVIQNSYPKVQVRDKGSYIRVMVPDLCKLNSVDVEKVLGFPFHLPSDLEAVMPSFKGTLSFADGAAIWVASRGQDR